MCLAVEAANMLSFHINQSADLYNLEYEDEAENENEKEEGEC